MCSRCGREAMMARALVVLACAGAAAAAGAARYADYAEYAGGKMPQYGADYEAGAERAPPADDYLGHSPDAPGSLDYKYEERHGNTEKSSNIIDDADTWRKVRRKQRGVHRPTERDTFVALDTLNNYSEYDDEEPAARRAEGRGKRRPRARGAVYEVPPSPPRRRSAKYTRKRNNQISDMRDIDKYEFSDDKSDFEEEVHFAIRDTTRRVIRRKPRDRSLKMFDDDFNTDDIADTDRRMEPDDEKRSAYPAGEAKRPQRPDERGFHQRYRPSLDDDHGVKQSPSVHRNTMHDDYNDYYDMKKVQNIKHKLPMLLRRTTTMKARTKNSPGTEIMHELWTNRRLGMVPSAPTAPSNSDADSDTGDIIDISAAIRSLPPSSSSVISLGGPTPTRRASVPRFIIANQSTAFPVVSSQELSFAEKSRLSILKKAQRKDGVKAESTMKPPVLLQVTQKLATVVMVEPPSSGRTWVRVRQMSADSPERIERVKKLMRHKLVAQAKNIHELTDNWDAMVCDYIDVALLDSGTPGSARHYRYLPIVLIVVIQFIYLQLK